MTVQTRDDIEFLQAMLRDMLHCAGLCGCTFGQFIAGRRQTLGIEAPAWMDGLVGMIETDNAESMRESGKCLHVADIIARVAAVLAGKRDGKDLPDADPE